MYAWIWRHLPFGFRGKLAGSILLGLGAVALLWFVIFPVVDPHLPFNNDGGVSTSVNNGPGPGPAAPGPPQSGQPGGGDGNDSVVPPSPGGPDPATSPSLPS
jgi:hypothetical protein